jgi:hypothetical protein
MASSHPPKRLLALERVPRSSASGSILARVEQHAITSRKRLGLADDPERGEQSL